MKGLDSIILVLWVILAFYVSDLLLIVSDLWSGLRKAKQRGEIRSSYGLKKTVDKIARYFNMLFAITLIDCIQMSVVYILNNYYGYGIPMLPVLTALGSVFIGFIEVKSIYEKADDKIKIEYEQAAKLVAELAKSKTNPEELAKAIGDYMKKESEESE
ncbi:phage holin family protein [uncultured Bacteroides sp.]|uniref:phage holin family protein n=1 Tax=uncultured Bacteroides sp. TaxID=162156 RepID=UPI002AA78F7D|nr:phage holin family protein [uncultured Bacteroides sp.]